MRSISISIFFSLADRQTYLRTNWYAYNTHFAIIQTGKVKKDNYFHKSEALEIRECIFLTTLDIHRKIRPLSSIVTERIFSGKIRESKGRRTTAQRTYSHNSWGMYLSIYLSICRSTYISSGLFICPIISYMCIWQSLFISKMKVYNEIKIMIT